MGTLNTKKVALIAAILGSGVVFLDGTVVNVALPAIRASLHGGLAEQQWVVEAYMLTLSSLLLVGGSLGDLFGRIRVFSAGLIGFGVCSLLCAIAPSSALLIGARAVQGIFGALLVPSTLALIMDTFENHERAAAIGSWTAWTGVATVIGPLGGGVLVQAASWRWIFAINLVPVVITLLLLRRLPADKRTPGHVDVVGAVLCTLGLAGPVFALIEQPTYGWGSARVAIPLVVGLVLLAAFVPWERRSPQPMLPLAAVQGAQLHRRQPDHADDVRRTRRGDVLPRCCSSSRWRATARSSPEHRCCRSPLIVFLLAKRFGALADRIGPHYFMAGGPVIAGLGLLLISRTDAHAGYISEILPGVIVFGLGLAMTVAPLTAAVLAVGRPAPLRPGQRRQQRGGQGGRPAGHRGPRRRRRGELPEPA